MIKNSYKFLFFMTLIYGTLMTISANSWFSMWMGLEINLLSFIPLMMKSKNLFSSESSLKYFLIQSLASMIFLFSILLFFLFLNFKIYFFYNFMWTLISSSILMKMGAAPFHFWFPSVMEGLNWYSNFIIMTWQKIAPLMILSYCTNFYFLIFIIILSVIFASMGGLNQTSLRKLMAFSSISHLGWMIASILYNENLMIFYFIFYVYLNMNILLIFNSFKLFNLNQMFKINNLNLLMKFLLFLTFFSLGGLPPFIGFFPKWMIIEMLIYLNLISILFIMLLMSLITMFFYLRITYSTLLMNHLQMNWTYKNKFNNSKLKILLMLSLFSLFGMLLINTFYYFL